jgi:hypothetical protein
LFKKQRFCFENNSMGCTKAEEKSSAFSFKLQTFFIQVQHILQGI